MGFRIDIATSNAAFQYGDDYDGLGAGPEVARILRKIADDIDAESASEGHGTCVDVNGNAVGSWSLTA